MNESYVTIVGNVVGDPQGRSTKAGKPFASFRVASTVRRWDAEQRRFVDGSTNFVSVVGFNALGGNIMSSLHKGDPVVVYGRLRVNQWVGSDGKNMTSVEIDAHGVGHDLTRGQSLFTRTERVQYDTNDRLADPAVQASLDGEEEREPGDVDEPERGEPSLVIARGSVGDFERTVEDADTDPYVVTV
ncbi:MAG: single-stranded DNA-binding protein [Lapillicoccus sp.]